MDFNEKVSREQAVIKKANYRNASVGELRYRYLFSWRTKAWVWKEAKVLKTTKFVDRSVIDIFELKESGVKLNAKLVRDESIPENKLPMLCQQQ